MATNAKWRLELREKMGHKRGERYTKFQTEACRAKIKTTAIINKLQAHLLDGTQELSATQVRCAEVLLSKSLASLQSQEIVADTVQYVVRAPSVSPTAEEWSADNEPKPVSTSLAKPH